MLFLACAFVHEQLPFFLLAMLALILDDRFMKGPGKYVFWMRGAYFENECMQGILA